MGRRGKVKSQDVADLAGVSRTTVSLVLNGRGDSIPPATQRKVFQAAEDLGFVPSAAARTLRRGRSRMVLCLSPGWMPSGRADRFWSDFSAGMEAYGFSCVFSKSAGVTTSLRQLLEEITPCAVVAFFKLGGKDEALLSRMGIPLVNQGGLTEEGSYPALLNFQHRVGFTQAGYLLDHGAVNIGYLGTNDSLGESICSARLFGVRRALEDRGMGVKCHVNVALDEKEVESALTKMRSDGVDAVCAFNDDYAATAVAVAGKQGVHVPDDMRIIGVDNILLGRYLSPSITTVEYGNVASEILADVLPALEVPVPRRGDAGEQASATPVWVVERASA